MHKIIAGLAIAAMWAISPAFAADKMGAKTDPGAGTVTGDSTRYKGEDGVLQGKPVVKGPADWSHARAPGTDSGSASSGKSSGEAGEHAKPARKHRYD